MRRNPRDSLANCAAAISGSRAQAPGQLSLFLPRNR